jgi:hypothetical protein
MANPIVPTRPLRLILRVRDGGGNDVNPATHGLVMTVQLPDGTRLQVPHTEEGDNRIRLEFDLLTPGLYIVAGIITYPDGGTAPTRDYEFFASGPSIAMEEV